MKKIIFLIAMKLGAERLQAGFISEVATIG